MSKLEFLFGGEPVESTIEKSGQSFNVAVGEQTFRFDPFGPGRYWVTFNGAKKLVAAVYSRGSVFVDIDSVLLEIKEPSEDGFAGGAGEHGGAKDKVFAPMPGKIVKIMVAVGDSVTVKQPLVIVEAMKMENQVNALANGVVKAINFAEGAQVDTERPMIELEIEATE
jgi:biotin carboxyl carrier protein